MSASLSENKGFLRFWMLCCMQLAHHTYQNTTVSEDFAFFNPCPSRASPSENKGFLRPCCFVSMTDAHATCQYMTSLHVIFSCPKNSSKARAPTVHAYGRCNLVTDCNVQGPPHVLFFLGRLSGGLPLRLEIMFCAC